MDAVKSFNAELSSLYEVKPPISKAKMTAITRGAIKAIKFYKHVVQSVEKFILKCKSEYKVPGLYVIDSIVRQSRHQFGADKDVFAPRFAKNMRQTFINLFACPAEDKSKIIRVLNLWQKNQVFAPDVIQPLFDLADPNNPIHKELGTTPLLQSNGMNSSGGAPLIKGSPALQKTPTKGSQQGIEGAHLGGANLNLTDPSVLVQLQQLQRLLTRGGDSSAKPDGPPVHFDRKLLDFDYGDDDDEAHSSPKTAPQNDSVSSLLTNPEVLRQLQTLQQTMTAGQPGGELDIDKLRKLQEMKQQEEEFDKHLAQTVPNLPFAAECEFKPGNNSSMLTSSYYLPPGADLSQPPPGYKTQYDVIGQQQQQQNLDNDVQFVGGETDNGADVEVINLDHSDSRSPSPHDDRYSSGRNRRRSRSRDRSRERRDRDRRSHRSRSRSKSRRHRSRSRDRNRGKEKETEKDKERKKRGLPAIKKENLSVCSTTLWVGHLSKLVHQEDLSNTFGEFGDIVSIDLIPPRGCAFIVMHRRQDAARCLTKLKSHMLHGKAITLAWAPGKGVKGKDLKDYWEGDLGVSYIPWHKLKPDIDIEMLEDGGMIDEDTMPTWMKNKMANILTPIGKQQLSSGGIPVTMDAVSANYLQLADVSAAASVTPTATVDTSQPPPVPGSGLLQPPPMALPLVSPFHQFNNRLLGMNIAAQSMLPPIGVPPPNLPNAAAALNQLVGLGSPFQTNLMGDNNKVTTPAELKSLSESLMSMTQTYGMIPQPPINLPSTQHDDNMDIEMEDAEKPERPPLLLSEQLQASMNQFNSQRRNNQDGDGDLDNGRGRRDRDRRNSHSRERDRNRDRGRLMNRDGYGDDRKDDRRERPNRWGDRIDIQDPNDRREREKTLNDRLQQMAMANEATSSSSYSNHDRLLPSRDIINDGPEMPPPGLLDRRMFPPPPHNNNNNNTSSLDGNDDIYLLRDDYDPPLLDDYHPPPPPPMMHHLDSDYAPPVPMHPRIMQQHRDDFDAPPPLPPQERFMRGGGRRDFRDNRRGPPPPDYFPRDGFGPRGMMRGGPDFPRPPLMRGPGPHKFHPRGPPMRLPRSNAPWKDRGNFGPRFDHPDFHRGPPGMYDDGPHRHRGGRFEDRRRPPRSDFGGGRDEMLPDQERFEKRNSRWGNESPKQHEEVQELVEDEELPDEDAMLLSENNKGGNTPLHDEPLNREVVGGDGDDDDDVQEVLNMTVVVNQQLEDDSVVEESQVIDDSVNE